MFLWAVPNILHWINEISGTEIRGGHIAASNVFFSIYDLLRSLQTLQKKVRIVSLKLYHINK